MPISVNPVFPVIAAQGAAEPVLQPGTVIDAEVLKILSESLVRIAIANLSIDVMSEVPLQVGQSLRLAVSQTPDGVRLALVGQGSVANEREAVFASSSREAAVANAALPKLLDVAPLAAGKPAVGTPFNNPLTAVQALAVSAAAQAAAARQNGLAPLFANLEAAMGADVLPPQLREAVTQMLALRPKLDQDLTGDVLSKAFRNSGLFLESSLASDGGLPSPGGLSDLKAALLVLRQTLRALGVTPEAPAGSPAEPLRSTPATPETAPHQLAAETPATLAVAPGLLPEIDVEEIFLPQARLPVAEEPPESPESGDILAAAPSRRAERATANAAAMKIMPEALQTIGRKLEAAQQAVPDQATALASSLGEKVLQCAVHDEDAGLAAHTNVPPPPFRGALPSAQPAMPSSIARDARLPTIAHSLAEDTDAAIGRQTLLQIASLPDRADIPATRADPAAPRWNFEIPFFTPAGTAIAQFEIARDGVGSKPDAARQVWRARFSLDVEPAGPVHALVSLAGERTSVRIWAERSATVARLHSGVSQLNHALSRAALQPGDIVIRHGTPGQPSPAAPGHFLDRAL